MDEFDKYIRMIGELESRKTNWFRRKILEAKVSRTEREHPDWEEMSAGGGLPDDYAQRFKVGGEK